MIPLPAWVDQEAWLGFCEMRRAMPKSKPFTHRAAVLILKELQKLRDAGHDANAALDQSTMRGWADVYVPKEKEIERAATKAVDQTAEYLREQREHAAQVAAQRAVRKAAA